MSNDELRFTTGAETAVLGAHVSAIASVMEARGINDIGLVMSVVVNLLGRVQAGHNDASDDEHFLATVDAALTKVLFALREHNRSKS